MKKLLSILAISGVSLGSTTNFLVSCNRQGKFDLNNIQLYNIDSSYFWEFKIKRHDLLYTISLQIMLRYNSQSFANKLKVSDFMYGSKPTKEHPWAIEVMNVDGKTPLVFNKQKVANLIFPPNYTVLANNALKVKITTTNQNANMKTATVNGYLTKFIYTNANLNQGHDLKITNGSGFVITGNKKTVFDISSKYIGPFAHNQKANAIIKAFKKLTTKKEAAISTLVFTALNKQLAAETKTLNDLGVLKTIDANKEKLPFNDDEYFRNQSTIYQQTGSNALQEVPLNNSLSTKKGTKIFIRFSFNNQSLEYMYQYLPRPKTYLYFYLGTTT